ncbi:hypothetical protein DE146DRAFT_180379 [Phaeosphaeria sp. MPI-PUGE-AT-0046c]|nr:hypothetical protein DE146DRAFT_180379 [Phaeosphaeria sp. MPI-PUGE-AT-0046c]
MKYHLHHRWCSPFSGCLVAGRHPVRANGTILPLRSRTLTYLPCIFLNVSASSSDLLRFSGHFLWDCHMPCDRSIIDDMSYSSWRGISWPPLLRQALQVSSETGNAKVMDNGLGAIALCLPSTVKSSPYSSDIRSIRRGVLIISAFGSLLLNAQQDSLDAGWHRVSHRWMPTLPSLEFYAQHIYTHI